MCVTHYLGEALGVYYTLFRTLVCITHYLGEALGGYYTLFRRSIGCVLHII